MYLYTFIYIYIVLSIVCHDIHRRMKVIIIIGMCYVHSGTAMMNDMSALVCAIL